MKTRLIFSDKCLNYGHWHIEGPKRVKKALNFLSKKSYSFLEPSPASEDDLLRVHEIEYIWNLRKGLVEDSDTPAYDNIFEYARLSAGGAILAAKTEGFSIMRPPGHHAGSTGSALGVSSRGFCYLNNIAIAVKKINKPTLILDIDGHHGNGTQEIFQGDPNVNFISLHRFPHYPGTGEKSKGNCLNFPLEADCGEKKYMQTLEMALDMIDLEKIELVGVSSGFDTHIKDLASLGLNEYSYHLIGKKIALLKKKTFFVLEGGYNGEHNGRDIDQLLKGYDKEKQKIS